MSGRGNPTGSIVTLHVVSSLDGFIAKKDNSVSWLEANGSVYEEGVSISEEEAATFVRAIDCYVLGSRTYEHALELGWWDPFQVPLLRVGPHQANRVLGIFERDVGRRQLISI